MFKKYLINFKNNLIEIYKLTLLQKIWLTAPILLWFSFFPKIALGEDLTMHYELSICLIYIAVQALVSLPAIWQNKSQLIKRPIAIVATIFIVETWLTTFWTPSKIRGVLAASLATLILIILLGILARLKDFKAILPRLTKITIGTGVLMSVLAIIQVVIGNYWFDLFLCKGCVAGLFGFPRANLFSIEPQFLGSILLIPFLMIVNQLLKKPNIGIAIKLAIVMIGLIATLSRGALFATGISAVILIALRGALKSKLIAIIVICGASIIGLIGQAGLAATNPLLKTSFKETIARSVNQISLGKIKMFRQESIEERGSAPITSPSSSFSDQPLYAGYVKESTNIRVNLANTALRAYADQPTIKKIFGTGLGSAGREMAKQTGSNYYKEIVQNQYIEILLERGLMGLGLLITLITMLIGRFYKNPMALAIMVGVIIQYMFFSGLPNALHVYIALIMLYGAFAGKDLPNGAPKDNKV